MGHIICESNLELKLIFRQFKLKLGKASLQVLDLKIRRSCKYYFVQLTLCEQANLVWAISYGPYDMVFE